MNSNKQGVIESSFDYSKVFYRKKELDSNVKLGLNQMIETISYYFKKQVDNEFLQFAIKYHLEQELAKQKASGYRIDKVNENKSKGRILLLSRLASAIN